jgi:hypothetical protein
MGTSRAAAKAAQEMLCGSISELCFNLRHIVHDVLLMAISSLTRLFFLLGARNFASDEGWSDAHCRRSWEGQDASPEHSCANLVLSIPDFASNLFVTNHIMTRSTLCHWTEKL